MMFLPRAERKRPDMRRLGNFLALASSQLLVGCLHAGAGLSGADCLVPPMPLAQLKNFDASLAKDRFVLVPNDVAQARLGRRNFVLATSAERKLLTPQPAVNEYTYLVRSAYLGPANATGRVSVPYYAVSYDRGAQSILIESFHVSEGPTRTVEIFHLVALPFELRNSYVACATAF